MSAVEERLLACFQAVFPQLRREQILTASPATVEAWDSVAMVTLATLIEEEFGIPVPAEALAELSSFAGAAAFLAQR